MITNNPGTFCFFASALLGLGLTPLVIRLAKVCGLVDLPGARKVHSHPVPRIGGLAIALATILPFAALALAKANLFGWGVQSGAMITLIVSSVAILLFGLIDDLANIPAKYKLLVLLLASVMFCGSGGVIRGFIFQGRPIVSFGLAAKPITILWMVGVTVGINFIDGLDGLAAGIVAMACAVLAICVTRGGNPDMALLPLALLGALVSFLVFNFNPARIFMGDCGSMFIGFLFAGCCVLAQSPLGTARGLFLPALALSIPIFDTFFTFVRRGILERRSLFSAEKGHIHHRLLDVGLCHRHVVLMLYTVTFLGAGVALISLLGSAWATGITAAVFCCGLFVLFRIAGTVRARETLGAIRRNRALGRESRRHRLAFEELQLDFRDVRTFDSWWERVCRAADLLDFAKIDLPLVRRDNSSTMLKWRRNDSELAEANSLTAEIPVPQRRVGQSLRVGVEVTVNEFLESAGQRLALFSRLIAECSPKELPDAFASPNDSDATEHEQMPNPLHAETASPKLACLDELSGLRVAIVHDFLYTYAGAERVLEQLIALFPDCDLFSIFDFLPPDQRGFIRNKKVRSTFIQRMPWARRKHRAYLPLMPLAIEQLDLSAYDIVISSSYLVAKGVLTRHDQLHICYCHTPVRYAWDLQNQYLDQLHGLLRIAKDAVARILLHYIRNWDVHSANNVDVFVTNSDFVGRRIKKVYRRDAQTIYPPVDTERFALQEQKEDFYVTASRLVPYKRIDLIVEAFARMPGRRLIVVGEGPEMEKIRAKTSDNVRLLGYQPVARLRHYLQRARAFVYAAEEDFGIVPVEAQACGTPVICFGRGGVTESVIDGKTGVHFYEQTVESIIDAVSRFEDQQWDPAEIRKNAERFSVRQFRQRFADTAKDSWAKFHARRREQIAAQEPLAQVAIQAISAVRGPAHAPGANFAMKEKESA
jgi:UDP-N-acetylmuramyl pentapeptide phosphotransferase/UDP-N-acetylglucosamine-1-phosphate transferase/glycosyltransferase involved in cell wall biosynthesis